MKRILKNLYQFDYPASVKIYYSTNSDLAWFIKIIMLGILLLLANLDLRAQTVSGGWDAAHVTGGNVGYTNHGTGVIQLLNTVSDNCQGAAVHETSDTYNPAVDGVFNKCYQIYFGCPDDDEIGSDTKGDGMAFSFWRNTATYNINNGACGGGLGYHDAASDDKMITIEFDTWSSQGNAGYDASYGGGTSGNNDEIAIHRDGISNDGGRITSVNAGNLEDGLEHTVCINYDPATDIMTVSIDGNNVLVYDLTGSGYELGSYFGAGELNQSWSSGKFGATNPVTVSDGADISDNLGGVPLCPASVVITSPSGGTSVGTCDGPVTITAAATPPAGNIIDSVEFFVDGVKIGVDNTDSYETIWDGTTSGSHILTATAHYSPSISTSTSSVVNITIGGGIERTNSAPVIDGTVETLWGNYAATSLEEVPWGVVSGASDVSATYQTMRDATHLYILVEVTDDDLQNDGGTDPWENDGVEIFIDMGNDKSGSFGADDYQYAFVYNSATITEYKHGATAGVSFSQGVKTGGYTMEISIPWSTLGNAPADGELIGFDVHVNDDDGGGTRDGKIAWNDATDIAHNNPSGFGTIEAAACNPCPTGVLSLSGDNTICDDGTSTSTLSVDFTGLGPYAFTYSIDGVTQPAITNISASSYDFQSATGAHTYELLTVTNATATGCTANATGTAAITAIDFPIGHNGTFTPPGTASLSVDDMGATYEWYDAPVNGNLVFTGPVFITPVLNDTTIYYVQIASGTSCRTEVRAIPTGEFFIPNLITPNGDAKNDLFEIAALPSGSALKVFNRWGQSVYQSDDYDNLWTGNNIADGVYYYDLKLPDGMQYKGWLNIVR